MPPTNFILLLFLGLLNFRVTEAQYYGDFVYLYHSCPNTTTFTENSNYKSNLNDLLSSLNSTSIPANGYSFITKDGGGNETIYGVFNCRGDVSTDECKQCVQAEIADVLIRCPHEKSAIIWYDKCMLRYSDQSFFGSQDINFVTFAWDTQNTTDQARFNQLLRETMNETAIEAAKGQTSGKKFAVKQASVTAFQTLYTLGQCTPYLTASGCTTCLKAAIASLPSCCEVKLGGWVLYTSCSVRYGTSRFYNIAAVAPPPAPTTTVIVPPAPPSKGKGGNSSKTIIAIVVPIVVASVLISMLWISFLFKKTKTRQAEEEEILGDDFTTAESLQYNLSTVQAATNSFSNENKVGEGGFGGVYKGTLANGQEVAVKRLSKKSQQGAKEFKTEVVLVAKLQQRNLVRLLGFCLEGQEKILIYEFVPNKSLDYFLFDPEKQGQLDWSRRYKIIQGISRGILYLHEDSRLKIIHRDLKASNVLLDEYMNPKISDFGMARIFGVHQTEASTNKIVGTYGYMSPEYAMHGQFSIKSDVYSFGVLVLEIISGKRNSSFYQTECAGDLLSYAWKHWSESTALELMDPILSDSYSINEVMRCIHIALLCVQEDPDDRPTMATTTLMLNSFSFPAPLPSQPALFVRGKMMPPKNLELDQSTNRSMSSSANKASITELEPR